MWEARLGQPDNISRWIIADHVEVVLQRSVSGALEIHEFRWLIHPDLPKKDERTQWEDVIQDQDLQDPVDAKHKSHQVLLVVTVWPAEDTQLCH